MKTMTDGRCISPSGEGCEEPRSETDPTARMQAAEALLRAALRAAHRRGGDAEVRRVGIAGVLVLLEWDTARLASVRRFMLGACGDFDLCRDYEPTDLAVRLAAAMTDTTARIPDEIAHDFVRSCSPHGSVPEAADTDLAFRVVAAVATANVLGENDAQAARH